MEEVAVLKELNDLRQLMFESSGIAPDFSVHSRDGFMNIVSAMMPEGKYSARDIEDAYLQLHLITELGGSHSPVGVVSPHVETRKSKNSGKYNVKFTPLAEDDDRRIIDDLRSREHTAQAFLEGWEMRPTITSPEHLADTADMLSRFVTTNSRDELANTGFRTNKKRGTPQFIEAEVQNLNDQSGGYDRLTRDYIVNQAREFGHDIAVELGGADESFNGRMQAKGANRAAREKIGALGAMRVLGPTFQKHKKRFAGTALEGYNDYLVA